MRPLAEEQINNIKIIGLIFISLLCSYFFVLNNGFLGDDYTRIFINPELLSFKTAIGGELRDRPLLMLSMWLDRQIFGFAEVGMRTISLFFHTLVGWQFFLFIKDLSPFKTKEDEKITLLLSLLFVLHPLHNQTINIIIQRGVIFASLFALLSMRYFFKYLKTLEIEKLIASILFLILGILSKPIISFLPFFFLFATFFHGDENKKKKWFVALYFPVLLIPAYFYVGQKHNIQNTMLSPLEYFLIQTEVVLHYFKQIILPLNLSYLYDFYPPQSLWLNLNWLYLGVIIGIFFLVRKITANKKAFLFFIGFYLSFLPESGFFPIKHLVFDHRTYLPLIFLSCCFGVLAIESEIWKSKYYRTGSLVLVISFFTLNQVRNFQIKPVENWMINTLENSISDDYYNFMFSTSLIELQKIDELTPIVSRYKEIYGDSIEYKVLIYSHAIFANPETKEDSITALKSLLVEPFPHIFPRQWLNSFLINRYDDGTTIIQKINIEKFLSQQMVYFFSPGERLIFRKVAKFYAKIANDIISDTNAQKQLTEPYALIRMKTILTYYYKQNFSGIDLEISSLIKNDPNSATLNRLQELISSRQ